MPKLMKLSMDESGIAHLVLDNPDERMNVISALFFEEFMSLLDGIEKEGKARGLIIESSKPGVFVAGADIKWLKDLKAPEQCSDFVVKVHIPFNRLEDMKIPTVAAIGGVCLGGGLELALACRWRVCADHTSPCRSACRR